MRVTILTYDADPDHGGFGARVHTLVQMFASFAEVRVVLTDWFQGPRVPGVTYVPFPIRDTAWTRLRRLGTFYKTDFAQAPPVDGADLVVVESLDLWGLADGSTQAARVLDEHNVYWELWRYDLENMPFFSTRLGRRRIVRQVLEPHLRRRAKEYEVRALREADATLVTSEVDRAMIFDELPDLADRIRVLPNTVDVERFPDLSTSEGSGDVVFVGNFAYRPNQEAARLIAEQIAPRLPRVRFVLVGGNPPPLPGKPPNVIVAGYVPDLNPLLEAASVCIAPLRDGSGTRLKILTYLASGKAVVATSKAVEGLEVTDGTHLILRDDTARFAEAVESLLRDPAARRELGRNGRRLVREHYDWRVQVRGLEAWSRGLVGGARERRPAQ